MAIKDQQRFKDTEYVLKGMKYLKFLLPKKSRRQLAEGVSDFERLRDLPDQFNGIFLLQGWVSNGVMNVDAAEEAVRLAEAEGVEIGEQYLEDYYNKDLDFLLRSFFAELQQSTRIKEAFKRRRLIEAAKEDHREERYCARSR